MAETELHRLQVLFAQWIARLILYAADQGTPLSIGEGWRSEQTCALYAERGIGIRDSLHPLRLAHDFVLDMGDGTYSTNSEDYRKLGQWWESRSVPEQGLIFCWGGNFKDKNGNPKPDGGHFSFQYKGIK